MRTPDRDNESPLHQLTPREAELLKKAGERVYALSRKLSDREREAQGLQSESRSLRELLAESHEVRKVLAAQVESLQKELDREYEERSELRRLLASLHVQMQELLPVITGLSRANELSPRQQARIEAPAPPPASRPLTRLGGRLRLAARELRGEREGRR
jgi:predicted RNase H-like nuclease (RuvC/YqgF family)